MTSPIDYSSLWKAVLNLPHHRDTHSIHGPDHWLRVERNACILANQSGASIPVVRLFALFHDSRRVNEWTDPEHGQRGAKLAAEMRGSHYDLSDEELDLLHHACCWHTDGHRHEDATIGTCWDADRLDLGRAGMIPDPEFMSTNLGAEIAKHGSVLPWLDLAKPHILDPENHHLNWPSFEQGIS